MPQMWEQLVRRNISLQKLKELLTVSTDKAVWFWIPDPTPVSIDNSIFGQHASLKKSPTNRRKCKKRFLEALEEARMRRAPVSFECSPGCHAVVFPLNRNDEVGGYVGVCCSEKPFPLESIQLAQLIVDTALREIERTQELKNLSETVQPRCVALSTVHTIHRLISSTLNLQELLPRVARLCCQVLRVQTCRIWLMDPEKHILVPKASIHTAKTHSPLGSSYKLGEGLIGQVAETCRVDLTARRMIVPLVEEECLGVIMVTRDQKAPAFGTLDQEILTTLSEQAVVAIRNAQMYETQERVTWGTIKSLSAILDGMDAPNTGRSSNRELLASVALALAERMSLPEAERRSIQYAALLHDAGRVGIPQQILHKPSKLAPDELALVKEQTVKGARMLAPLEILEPAVPIVLYHHERYDGTGYPKGLRKDAIPLGARILGVANAFEAMISERPYRKALSVPDAAQEIASHAGTQFDPKVVDAFLSLAKDKTLEKLVRSSLKSSAASGK